MILVVTWWSNDWGRPEGWALVEVMLLHHFGTPLHHVKATGQWTGITLILFCSKNFIDLCYGAPVIF